MRNAWRIVKAQHAATAFSGEGAAKTGGRWNSRGMRVVYASSTQSLAALELLVHLNPPVLFRYQAFLIEFDDALVTELPHEHLPPEWQSQPPPPSTQQLGDLWLHDLRSPILAVPSVLVPDERNYLLNPNHPEFRKVRVAKPRSFTLDPRLVR